MSQAEEPVAGYGRGPAKSEARHGAERDFPGLIDAAMAVPLRGWDFSFLAGRIAVEPHPPNLALAAVTLSPRGIEVRARVGAPLPAADGEVDLVLNRHGALDAREAYRVLQAGGTLLSQQVGRHNDAEFNDALGIPALDAAALESVGKTIATLADAGFQVARCEQARPPTRYLDVGAIVLQLRAVPWQVPGFDVEQHLEQLRRIHHHIGQHGSFTVTSHRLLLVAHRPAQT